MKGDLRSLEIVRLHVDEGKTLAEIGRSYGISRERVRQIVNLDYGRTLTKERAAEKKRLRKIEVQARREALAARAKEARNNHGFVATYDYYGCRCDACRRAWANYQLRLRTARKEVEPPTHGNNGYINYGCRCHICKQENAQYQQRQYQRRKQKERAHEVPLG